MDLTQYKDIFGAPGTGVHAIRVMDIALVDFGLTVLASEALTYYTQRPRWLNYITMFITGINAHYIFGVDTTVNKWII